MNRDGEGGNLIVLRYAEILLTYAEAKNEFSGPDQSVYDAINHVRRRAGQPEISGLGQAELRERIRNERRVELAFENKRYFDIMQLANWRTKSLVGPSIRWKLLIKDRQRWYLRQFLYRVIIRGQYILREFSIRRKIISYLYRNMR